MKIDLNKSGIIAKSQLVSFLRLPEEGNSFAINSSKKFFNYDYLPEGNPDDLNWEISEIYDFNNRLIFRDHSLSIDDTQEIRLRVSADDSLIAPVWSVKAGSKLNLKSQINELISELESSSFEPINDNRIICYSYPKLGIMVKNQSGKKYIRDLYDDIFISLELDQLSQDSPNNKIWSPYEMVSSATIGKFRESWKVKHESISKLTMQEDLLENVVKSRELIKEKSVYPELKLIGQKTPVFCAVACGVMILAHNKIDISQDSLADLMNTGSSGTSNPSQVKGYESASNNLLDAIYDRSATFIESVNEINNNRPFKSGVPGHARVCAGYKIDDEDREYLYIFDPWPKGRGDIYYEDCEVVTHTNQIFVRPTLLS